MYKTLELLEQLKKVTGWSEYRLALELEISTSTIGNWRTRGSVMNDRTGQIAAQLLDIPEKLVMLSLAAERAMNELSGPYLADVAEFAIKEEAKKAKPRAGQKLQKSNLKNPAIARAESGRLPFRIMP
jgi:hypothetical protein